MMSQDTLNRLHNFLFDEKHATLDWLPDLVPLLPKQLLWLIVQIAEASLAQRESLLKEVAKRLKPDERKMLLSNASVIGAAEPLVHLVYPVIQGTRVSLAFNLVNSFPYEIPVEVDGEKLANVGTMQRPKYVFDVAKEPAECHICEFQNPLHESGLRGARIDLYVKTHIGSRYPDLRLRPKTEGGLLEFYVKDQSASSHVQQLFQQLPLHDQKRFLEMVLSKVKEGKESGGRDSSASYRNRELDERRLQRRGSRPMKEGARTDFSHLRYVNSEVLRKYRDKIAALESARRSLETTETANLEFNRKLITPERRDIVNLGFSDGQRADKFYDKSQALICEQSYYFWFNIGAAMSESIGPNEPINVGQLPPQAQLHVALFGFENEIEVMEGEDVGVLQVLPDSSFVVAKQAAHTERFAQDEALAEGFLSQFLLFPVRTPAQRGDYRLRCNIYCEQVLLQSYVVTAHVASQPTTMPEPFDTTLDYALSRTLEPDHLTKVASEPHLLSLMLNSNGDGSYTFRFFGADDQDIFKNNALIDGNQMKGFLKVAREAMNKVSWDDESQWLEKPKFNYSYRYQKESFDEAKLAKDLAYLARAGWRIYVGVIQHLQVHAKELWPLMRNTGTVQVALKMSPRAVLPVAVVYDYNWDPDAYDFDSTRFTLCETFSAAIASARENSEPLENAACFNGGCALKARIDEVTAKDSGKTLRSLPPMICPSGFWGYRHHVGLPLTRDGASSDKVPLEIVYKEEPEIVVGVSTDPTLVERDSHLDRLKVLKTPLGFERGESYDEIVLRLKKTAPHLLYFYCHGGIRKNNFPYLQIGKDDKFAPEHLIGEGILWDEPHPLVFINGCNTTSLNPEITLDFVSAFVQQGGAAGVIGTEITIFEPLAVRFAEECLRRFLGAPPFNESISIGKAVRGARLELLRRGNPLGLVYIPFTIASLKMEQRS